LQKTQQQVDELDNKLQVIPFVLFLGDRL